MSFFEHAASFFHRLSVPVNLHFRRPFSSLFHPKRGGSIPFEFREADSLSLKRGNLQPKILNLPDLTERWKVIYRNNKSVACRFFYFYIYINIVLFFQTFACSNRTFSLTSLQHLNSQRDKNLDNSRLSLRAFQVKQRKFSTIPKDTRFRITRKRYLCTSCESPVVVHA